MGVHNCEQEMALAQNIYYETAVANALTLRDDYPYGAIVCISGTTSTAAIVIKQPTVAGLRVTIINYKPAGTENVVLTNAGGLAWTGTTTNITMNAAGELAVLESVPDITSGFRWICTALGGVGSVAVLS